MFSRSIQYIRTASLRATITLARALCLRAASEPGLQVQGRDGQWQDVPCDFGTLVINTGDMLAEASRGYYPSTLHRVVNPVGEAAARSRVALPLFLHPRDEVVLSERYSAGRYLAERLRELGVKG